MANEWQTVTIADVATKVTKGTTPTTIGGKFTEQGINFIKAESIAKDGRMVSDKLGHIDESTNVLLSRSILEQDDILFTIAGTIGRVAMVPLNVLPANTNQAVAIVRPNTEVVLPRFLYYVLRDEKRVGQAHTRIVQSVQANFSLGELSLLEIPLPPLPEQGAIANILGTLDDKIELNRKMNETLEAIARALWKEMFIENADPNWEKGRLGDYITVKGGTTPSTTNPEFWNGDIYWTSPRDLSGSSEVFLHETEKRITRKGLSQIGSGLLPVGSVLLSSRAPIGYLAISNIPVAINQGYIAIICDRVFSNYYMFYWIKSNMDLIISSANGSTFLEISKSVFKDLEAMVPKERDIEEFNSVVKPIFDKISTNEAQIRTLASLRDTLLPKLISGELRIKDAERFVKEKI